MLVFYVFAAVVIWLGILSLRNGFDFARYVRRELARPLPDFTPFASVIVPCRGLDEGLRQNLDALVKQDYPAYEIIFVVDKEDDPALKVIDEIISRGNGHPPVSARIVVAGDAVDSGQKVHNLRVAVSHVEPQSQVLVFADTDARPQATWLRSLVAPLAEKSIGASTGYRWFLPVSGGFASHLRSVWNASIASALGERRDKNFCWGGSTAILRTTFDAQKISECWRGTVSDDFTMTRVLQEAKLPIHFVPVCLVASLDGCSMRELLEFTNRQLKITRVYAPHLWRPVLFGSLIFCAVFFGGLALVILRALWKLPFAWPLILLGLIYVLGAAKAYIRLRAASLVLKEYSQAAWSSLPAHLLLWPLSSALLFWNALAAVLSQRITWRGITYELKSPTEAVIVSKQKWDRLQSVIDDPN